MNGQPPLQYALVAYVQNDLGRFVEEMRRDLHPEHSHLAAHITILPPRFLATSEDQAIRTLQREVPLSDAFEVSLGRVESFYPKTPTVFLTVDACVRELHDLHRRLSSGPLAFQEEWPYAPHLTIVKMPELAQTDGALAEARLRWERYHGQRTVRIEELTFVREGLHQPWVDLATIGLRRRVTIGA
ncbi:MAG: 2'-5' RNA ligase family protein [Acidobacteriales bacterium]|nr:2'-5' RNA ligase family protein [Terriglobales bacterium]